MSQCNQDTSQRRVSNRQTCCTGNSLQNNGFYMRTYAEEPKESTSVAGEVRQLMVQVNGITWSHQWGINRGATGALWLSGMNLVSVIISCEAPRWHSHRWLNALKTTGG